MALYIIIIVASVILDQLVKWWVVNHVDLYQTVFNNPLLSITNIRNDGAAWSILEGKMWFFVIISIIALIILPYLLYKYKNESKWLTIGLSLIIGGTIGNFIDRLRLNYVVDMFQLEVFDFPIFNVADASLVVGVICVFVYILFFESNGKKEKK